MIRSYVQHYLYVRGLEKVVWNNPEPSLVQPPVQGKVASCPKIHHACPFDADVFQYTFRWHRLQSGKLRLH